MVCCLSVHAGFGVSSVSELLHFVRLRCRTVGFVSVGNDFLDFFEAARAGEQGKGFAVAVKCGR